MISLTHRFIDLSSLVGRGQRQPQKASGEANLVYTDQRVAAADHVRPPGKNE